MKITPTILALTGLGTLLGGCGHEPKPPTTPPTPVMSLDSLSHALGTIPEGEIKQEFRFRNQLQQPIRLLSPLTSCACNKVSYSANEIQPGETFVATARFNGKAKPGVTQSHFQIPWIADETDGTLHCVIEATVEKALKLTPDRPEIHAQNGSQAKVVIEQRHGSSKPTSVWLSRNEISGSISQIDATHWEVTLKWQEDAPDETRLPPLANDGAVLIVYAEGIGHQQYRLPVRVRQRSQINELTLSFNTKE